MILLDTNVLIDLDRYRLDTTQTYGGSILSRAELEFGIQMARTPHTRAERTRRLTELDDVFDWLPFDLASTRSYGIVAASARVAGAKARGKDALIAAQAHRYNAAVMTRPTWPTSGPSTSWCRSSPPRLGDSRVTQRACHHGRHWHHV